MSKSRRSQLFSDEAVQGELLFRAIVYWFFCLMVVSLMVLGWSMYSGPPRPLADVVQQSLVRCAPAVLGSVALLPVVLFDVLKVSSRFVGPIQQVRHAMRMAATGESPAPVELRKDDFWQDLAFYTNEVIERLDPTPHAEADESRASSHEFRVPLAPPTLARVLAEPGGANDT